MRSPLLLLAALALRGAPFSVAGAGEAAPGGLIAEPERVVRELIRLVGERDRLAGERRQLAASATSLIDEIARLKQQAGGVHAGPELTRKLRTFDRLAAELDAGEARLAGMERRMLGLRQDFERAAAAAERELAGRGGRDAQATAETLARLATERERLLALLGPAGGFRPLLRVTLDPLDGLPELEAKLAIIDGERARAAERRDELRMEERLLATRLAGARQWARDLGAARREASGAFEALERGYERAEALSVALEARMTAIRREGLALQEDEVELMARRAEVEGRLRSLAGGRR
jgi:hypothetical protein